MRTLGINTPSPYNVTVGPGARHMLGQAAAGRVFLVSDENVAGLYLEEYSREADVAGSFVMRAGELHKDHATLTGLYEAMAKSGVSRGGTHTIVAVGGGVVCDVSNFAAATYMRGIPFIACPTTLMAMADAAIGGKCGVNIGEGKNLVGTVRQPAAVISDTDTLSTLPARELSSGMAEIVKCGAIGDAELFGLCMSGGDIEELIYRACAVKKRYVELDEFDNNERHILNFGHTVGHAVERASRFSLTHGEAVSIGLVAEARLGERMGVTEDGVARELEKALAGAGLPVRYTGDASGVRLNLGLDKKRGGDTIRTAVPVRIGEAAYMDVPVNEFLKVI